jgi:hypothetical protein
MSRLKEFHDYLISTENYYKEGFMCSTAESIHGEAVAHDIRIHFEKSFKDSLNVEQK